jgi:hypothetical protein
MAEKVAPGKYLGRVKGQALTKAQTSGNFQVLLKMDVIGKKDAYGDFTELDDTQKVERSLILTLTAKTSQKVLGWMKTALGWEPNTANGCWGEVDPNRMAWKQGGPGDFIGREIEVECKHDAYQGKVREKWEIPFAQREIVALEDGDLDVLNTLYGVSQ